ncbi:MAG: hypothetical protein ACE5K4_09275 [Candidatus Hydrothermarchaeota archaeon]
MVPVITESIPDRLKFNSHMEENFQKISYQTRDWKLILRMPSLIFDNYTAYLLTKILTSSKYIICTPKTHLEMEMKMGLNKLDKEILEWLQRVYPKSMNPERLHRLVSCDLDDIYRSLFYLKAQGLVGNSVNDCWYAKRRLKKVKTHI